MTNGPDKRQAAIELLSTLRALSDRLQLSDWLGAAKTAAREIDGLAKIAFESERVTLPLFEIKRLPPNSFDASTRTAYLAADTERRITEHHVSVLIRRPTGESAKTFKFCERQQVLVRQWSGELVRHSEEPSPRLSQSACGELVLALGEWLEWTENLLKDSQTSKYLELVRWLQTEYQHQQEADRQRLNRAEPYYGAKPVFRAIARTNKRHS